MSLEVAPDQASHRTNSVRGVEDKLYQNANVVCASRDLRGEHQNGYIDTAHFDGSSFIFAAAEQVFAQKRDVASAEKTEGSASDKGPAESTTVPVRSLETLIKPDQFANIGKGADQAITKLLSDPSVCDYLRKCKPGLLREYYRSDPTYDVILDCATFEKVTTLKEVIRSLIKTARLTGSDCPCPELAQRLDINPATGDQESIWELLEQLENTLLEPRPRAQATSDLLQRVSSRLETEEKITREYFSGIDEKLVSQYRSLRKQFLESFNQIDTTEYDKHTGWYRTPQRFDYAKERRAELKAAVDESTTASAEIKNIDAFLNTFPPSVHAAWERLQEFESSNNAATAKTNVLALERIQNLRYRLWLTRNSQTLQQWLLKKGLISIDSTPR